MVEELESIASGFESSGLKTSRFVEGRATRKNKRLIRKLADAISKTNLGNASSGSGYLLPIIGVGLRVAAVAQSGCAAGPQIVYPSGAPEIIVDFGSLSDVGGRRFSVGTSYGGIGIKGKKGDLVLAAADGVVVQTTSEYAGGNIIRLLHGVDADGQSVVAAYMRNSEHLVKVGDKVKRGQPIARVGNTGNFSYGIDHLLFIVEKGRTREYQPGDFKVVNPHELWVDGPFKITCFDPSRDYRISGVKLTYPVACKR